MKGYSHRMTDYNINADHLSDQLICKKGTKDVIGYYCLSAGSINHIESTPSLKRNMPDPIPVVLLGRLAVDVEYQGKKLVLQS